jgi:serine/threonine-protein kinase
MLLGKTPFDADNVAELISAHLVQEPPRPSTLKADIDPELEKLLFNMIAKDPDKRPGLGEVRRIVGMQLSRSSHPLMTPPEGMPVLSMPAGASGQFAPPKAESGGALAPPVVEAVAAPRAAQPRWPLYVAIALAVAGVVALFAVL